LRSFSGATILVLTFGVAACSSLAPGSASSAPGIDGDRNDRRARFHGSPGIDGERHDHSAAMLAGAVHVF